MATERRGHDGNPTRSGRTVERVDVLGDDDDVGPRAGARIDAEVAGAPGDDEADVAVEDRVRPAGLEHQFGDPLEGSLHEAFAAIDTGRCSTTQAAGATEQRTDRDNSRRARGWQSVVGAH